MSILSPEEHDYILRPNRKRFRMNFIRNQLNKTNHISVQERKLTDYLEDINKDQEKYCKVKDSMKRHFFHIKSHRPKRSNNSKNLFTGSSEYNEEIQQVKPLFTGFITERRPTTRRQFSKEVDKILNISTDGLSSHDKIKQSKKISSYIDKKRKSQEAINNERDLILKFIKKSQSMDMRDQQNAEISNKQKFTMDFSSYLKRKSEREINKHIYETKIKKKTKPLQKFQDFILEEVKFSQDHKDKLSVFFTKMREEFRRAEGSRSTE